MNIHSLKHNAKASAKRICARFSGIEVVEPVKAMPQPGALPDGWYASVRVMDGVLPSSIAPEVLEAAHLELPEGWMVYNGNSIQRVADVRGVDVSASLVATAERFAALNPDGYPVTETGLSDPPYFRGANPASTLVIGGEDVTLEEAQDAAAFMSAVVANGGTNDGMGAGLDPAVIAAIDAQLVDVKAGSKEADVFAMLRRPAGATVAEIAVVMGWLAHTTRAYISVRTRKRGLEAVTEKVDGRGTVYRVRVPAQQAA